MQQLEPAMLYGVTKNDLQEIYDNALTDLKARVFFLDASYLYNFHLDDFEHVKKFNLLGRYDVRANIKWHEYLERWYQDQTVTLGGRTLKPIKISRTLDRVVNEGMEMIANFIVGIGSASAFDCRGIADGQIDEVSLADTDLNGSTKDYINVNTTAEGGSISRVGSTIMSVGNHSKDIETPADEEFTECVMTDDTNPAKLRLFDHSVFDDPIVHRQGEDAPGSTTIVYMCSG